MIKSVKDLSFIFDERSNFKDLKSTNLLYRMSEHGAKFSDFHSRCDDKGPTLVLMKCSNGRVCGGYTSVSWSTGGSRQAISESSFMTIIMQKGGGFRKDEKAFLFSVDLKTCYLPPNPDEAVFHGANEGPNFGQPELALFREPMDGQYKGVCHAGKKKYYDVPKDDDGNSPLTGQGKDRANLFTCAECEVY